jgi:hypothetical protein
VFIQREIPLALRSPLGVKEIPIFKKVRNTICTKSHWYIYIYNERTKHLDEGHKGFCHALQIFMSEVSSKKSTIRNKPVL